MHVLRELPSCRSFFSDRRVVIVVVFPPSFSECITTSFAPFKLNMNGTFVYAVSFFKRE